MPIDTRSARAWPRPCRRAGRSWPPGCTRRPDARVLRRLRVRHFSGQLLDEPATIADAARDAGLDPGELAGWEADPEVAASSRRT